MKKRIALLIGSPAPVDPGLEALCRSNQYDFKIFYCNDHQPGMPWDIKPITYPHEFMKNWSPITWHSYPLISSICPSIWTNLSKFRPNALVVHGYSKISDLIAITWAHLHSVPIFFRGDSNILEEGSGNFLKKILKKQYLSLITSGKSGALAVGTLNRDYWNLYGIPLNHIFHTPFAIDTTSLKEQAQEHRKVRDKIKHNYGLNEPYQALFLGRFVWRKRVDLLIEAMRLLALKRPDIGLTIVGTGPLEKELVSRASGLSTIHFCGFKDRNEIPVLFAASDVLVCPSQVEPWGLVICEAMASGLPVISYHRVGAAHDLVKNGQTGYLIPQNDAEHYAAALDNIFKNKDELATLGANAQSAMENLGIDAYTRGYHCALDSIFAEVKN